jgi:hypothetical protein
MDFQEKRVKEEKQEPLVLPDYRALQEWLDKLDLKDPQVY